MNRQGAVGALLDIYEQAITDLQKTIADIPAKALIVTIDPQTTDTNCQSIQTILTHVVSSGFGYATSIQNLKGPQVLRPDSVFHSSIEAYQNDLNNVFIFTENVFNQIKDNDLETFDNAGKIKTGWGQWYDIEQLTEHAIVHILRHKRQIEKIKCSQLYQATIG